MLKGCFLINVIKIICIIIGTFVGAGFASGKEILLFFYQYGTVGIIGIAISVTFIGFIIYKTIFICKRENINDYNKFLDLIISNILIREIIKKSINIFLLISFGVMISGFCSFIKQEFFIEKYISYVIIITICIYAFSRNLKVLINISNILVPIIILFIMYCTIKNYLTGMESHLIGSTANSNLFFIDAILYSNYNLLGMIPIVIIVSNSIRKKIDTVNIAFFSAIIIGLLACCMFKILKYVPEEKLYLDFPIVKIIEGFGSNYRNLYCMIIAFSIVTTALSVGYTYIQNSRLKLSILLFFSFIAVQVSFSELLKTLYPVCGVIGVVQCFFIVKK